MDLSRNNQNVNMKDSQIIPSFQISTESGLMTETHNSNLPPSAYPSSFLNQSENHNLYPPTDNPLSYSLDNEFSPGFQTLQPSFTYSGLQNNSIDNSGNSLSNSELTPLHSAVALNSANYSQTTPVHSESSPGTYSVSSINTQNQCSIRQADFDLLTQPLDKVVTSNPTDNDIQVKSHDRKDNYIYQILASGYAGKHLLAAYDFEKDPERRRKLLQDKNESLFSYRKVAREIVNHEFNRTESYFIAPERLDHLAGLAAEIFEPYPRTIFYTKADPKSKRSAGGALQVYYSHQREKEVYMGRAEPLRNGKRKKKQEFVSKDDFGELEIQVESIDEDYKIKWINTDLDERFEFYGRNKKVDDIFRKLKPLTHLNGFILIKADFIQLYNETADKFAQNWPGVAENIIKYAYKICTPIKEPEIHDLISKTVNYCTEKKERDQKEKENIAKEITTNLKVIKLFSKSGKKNVEIELTNDHFNTLALLLLPLVFKKFNKSTNRSENKTTWVPSKRDIQKSFIYHQETTENFNTTYSVIEGELKNLHVEHKFPLQPHVIICGKIEAITSAYVVLGKYRYLVSSAADAVDLCFQCMKVFQRDYSCVCNHVWQFLEILVYHWPVQSPYSSVSNVEAQLKLL